MNRPQVIFHNQRSRDVLAAIISIHFPAEANTIADLTWGKGAFWATSTAVVGLDLAPRLGCQVMADCRNVPLRDQCVDIAVFDPPFMHGPSKTTTLGLQEDYTRLPNQKDVRALYAETGSELRRIARRGAIVKCSDIIESGRLNLNHVFIVNTYQPFLGDPADYAILDSGVVRPVRPGVAVQHLRQSHSYFLVYKWGKKTSEVPHE